jgi:nitrogenase molybdenum-cofactor synthesis protein NifE
MIGDDMDNVCGRVEQKYGIPIVVVHSPGFVGNKNLGSRLGGEAVLSHLIGTKEPKEVHPFGINLIGEYNVTGDMWQYIPILEKIGIKVVSTLAGDGRIENIQMAHRAKLNVIVCAKSLITLCRKMQEQYEIPYISISFYGKRDTTNAIMSIVNAFGDEELIKKAKIVIAEEEAKLEDIEIAKSYVPILIKSPANEQAKLIDEHGVDILLAGGRSLYTAIKKKIAFVDVNQEKKVSYGAYSGLINLAKDVVDALNNPVFKVVGTKAPWEIA